MEKYILIRRGRGSWEIFTIIAVLYVENERERERADFPGSTLGEDANDYKLDG